MIDKLLNNIPEKQQGLLVLAVGTVILLISLGQLGIPQMILHGLMIFVGASLVIWGLEKSDLLKNIKKLLP